MRSYNPTTTGHKGQIKRALQTLVAAKKPVVYVGGGAITAGCHQQLKETVEALNLPVVSSLMGWGHFRQRIVRRWACWECTAPTKPI